MQGSLDAPPIVVRISRMASLIGFMLCAVTVYFRIYLFGIGLIYFGWQFLDPNMITIAPDGLGWRTTFRRRHWAWSQVCNPLAVGSARLGRDGKSHSIFGFSWEMGARNLVELLNTARSRWSSASARNALDPSAENS